VAKAFKGGLIVAENIFEAGLFCTMEVQLSHCQINAFFFSVWSGSRIADTLQRI
jgi:hypothetical protein